MLGAPPADCPPVDDRFLVEVTFTVGSRYGVPVVAEFSCLDARTVTMQIVDGEGTGSVVETHATPAPGADGRPRTAVIEAVVAHSDRPGAPGGCAALDRWSARSWLGGKARPGATTSPTPSAGTPCAERRTYQERTPSSGTPSDGVYSLPSNGGTGIASS